MYFYEFFTHNYARCLQKILKNIISFSGLVLIIVGLISIKSNGVYPGKKALIPVFGAIFIIAAGKDAFINRILLSNKVMVFLGLISYPLYLWHWPLLSFTYIIESENPSRIIKFSVLVISLFLSVVTFLFIEPHLRYGKRSSVKSVVLLTTMLTISVVSLSVYKINYSNVNYNLEKNIYGGEYTPELLVTGDLKGDSKLAVIGDSHIKQYAPYFNKKIPYEAFYTSGSMCYKYINSYSCTWNKNVDYDYAVKQIESIIKNTKAKKILIGHEYAAHPLLRYFPGSENKFFEDLEKQILYLASKYDNKEFYYLEGNYKVPSLTSCLYKVIYNYKIPKILEILRASGYKCDIHSRYKIKQDKHEIMMAKTNELLKKLSENNRNIHFVSLRDITCNKDGCILLNKDGYPLFSDRTHISIWGRDLIASKILERIGL